MILVIRIRRYIASYKLNINVYIVCVDVVLLTNQFFNQNILSPNSYRAIIVYIVLLANFETVKTLELRRGTVLVKQTKTFGDQTRALFTLRAKKMRVGSKFSLYNRFLKVCVCVFFLTMYPLCKIV